MLQPRMFGGYEFDLVTYYRISTEIARGSAVVGLVPVARRRPRLQASFFPEQAQRRDFGPDGHFRCAGRDTPGGTARAVDGGYMLNGTWRYSSGGP